MLNENRVLYVDQPFHGEKTPSAERSSFLWRSLAQRYPNADLLLLREPACSPSSIPSHPGPRGQFILAAEPPTLFAEGCSLRLSFRGEMEFRELLRWHRYEIVIFRGPKLLSLADICREALPESQIIIDVERFVSRDKGLKKPLSIRRRVAENRARRVEERLLQRPFQLLLAEREDCEWAKSRTRLTAASTLSHLPNPAPMNFWSPSARRVMLFHGGSSPSRLSVFSFFVKEIYPLVHEALVAQDWWVRVAGISLEAANEIMGDSSCGRIELLGENAEIEREIHESRFVVYPSRSPGDSSDWIFQVASAGRTVVTTPEGANGFPTGEDAVVLSSAVELGEAICQLMFDPETPKKMGLGLRVRAQEEQERRLTEVFWRELAQPRSNTPVAATREIRLDSANMIAAEA